MPAETTYLPTQGDAAPLGVMTYLAVLAYPDDWDKRDRFTELFKAWLTIDCTGARPAPIPNASLLGNGLFRIRVRRIYAAEIAHMVMSDSSEKKLSVAAALRHFATIHKREDESFILRHIWGESKPVLHLALALKPVIEERRMYTNGTNLQKPILVYDTDWLPYAIRQAENWRVHALPRLFQIGEQYTIRVLPSLYEIDNTRGNLPAKKHTAQL